jgi:hypothetical protein
LKVRKNNFHSTKALCYSFFQTFRQQSIDGSALLLLGEDHLMRSMKMKLGPILKLKSALKKLNPSVDLK